MLGKYKNIFISRLLVVCLDFEVADGLGLPCSASLLNTDKSKVIIRTNQNTSSKKILVMKRKLQGFFFIYRMSQKCKILVMCAVIHYVCG